jgi:molybdopterin-containing oxidoreductase family iron-sulfur binding subunit
MSLDQCHSTIDAQPARKPRSVSHEQVGVDGRKYWRGLEDAADTPEFRDWLEKEFPTDASRLLASSRRTFLKLMGASVALAGAATLPGCRRPDHKIHSYSRSVPEDVVPGKSEYYATSLCLPGGAVEGILCETHEGRPTKVEGNPLHPGSNGKSSAWAQASILCLYDPDRLKDPTCTGVADQSDDTPRSWLDFSESAKRIFDPLRERRGSGLAFIVDKKRSATREAMKARVMKMYPGATWVAWDPVQSDEAVKGSVVAFGKPMREVLSLENADVIVSFGRDFLNDDPGMIRNSRGFAANRSPMTTQPQTDRPLMSRLYMVESSLSITGAKADHRLAVAPSIIPAIAAALASKLAMVGASSGSLKTAADRLAAELPGALGPMAAEVEKFVEELARDLVTDEKGRARREMATGRVGAARAVVVAGPSQPAAVHALCHAINAAIGAVGHTVHYRPMSEDEASSGVAGLKKIADALNGGEVSTLVCLGVNPAYDAPGDLDFARAMTKAANRITLAHDFNETIAASTWRLPMAHALESWGDLESIEGVHSPVQPMIAPLYGGKTDLEVLAMICGDELAKAEGYDIVRSTWKAREGFARGDFERSWRRSLNEGVFTTDDRPTQPRVDGEAAARALGEWNFNAPAKDIFDVVFDMGPTGDGRFSNNAWLNELPDPITKVVWDNVAMVSTETARKFGLEQDGETAKKRYAHLIRVVVGAQSVLAAAWVLPPGAIAENTIALRFGYGRTKVGRVGEGTGHNMYPIAGLGGASRRMVSGARLERPTEGDREYQVVTTQHHGSMEGRSIIREVDLLSWQVFGDDPFVGLSPEEKNKLLTDSYGNRRTIGIDPATGKERDLNFAERLGELSHAPANANVYVNPQRGSKTAEIKGTQVQNGSTAYEYVSPIDASGKPRPVDYARRPQWGMSIDLGACTGCSACTIACQAENNIPVVGKIEVNKGREMHWIRVDRYYAGTTLGGGMNASDVTFQPVACIQCENAPCETVCPVNATVHGPEGINYMVYNRCIGTRYCANNCPYKVRRFNFFDYGVKKINGDYIGEEAMKDVGVAPKNVNLIPPRLRERLDEITKLGMNPDVTIRSRGVMEKCNYCLQRINEARIEIKLKNLPGDKEAIPDGYFQVACQQACPSDAIVFGDISDTRTKYPVPGGKTRTGSRVNVMRDHGRSYMLLGYLNTRPRTTYMAGIRNPNMALVSQARLERMKNPFKHEEAEEGGGSEHEHSAGEKQAMGNVFNPDKSASDAGYRLSLAVLEPTHS